MAFNTAEYREIASTLKGTRGNVYSLAESLFGREFTEDDWSALRKAASVFRCEECSVWKDTTEEEPEQLGYCIDCVAEMNGEGEDE